ncbi:hypothetical protein ACFVTC_18155 [Streptomyces sp. NPDC057950]
MPERIPTEMMWDPRQNVTAARDGPTELPPAFLAAIATADDQ